MSFTQGAVVGVGVGVEVGASTKMLTVFEKVTKLKVVLAYAVLPGGMPKTAPALLTEVTVMGEEALVFQYQTPELSQT
mgnify:FL=1